MQKIQIIYEDEDILVVNKPAGILVHPTQKEGFKNTNEETLLDWLLGKYPEVKDVGDDLELRPGIVHRLDKDTSGVLLVVKKQFFFKFFKKQFSYGATRLASEKKRSSKKDDDIEDNSAEQKNGVKKRYIALVCGNLKGDKGVIDRPIGVSSSDFRRKIAGGKMRGKIREAITEYRVLERLKDAGGVFYTLLEVFPRTGRTHQIRAHLRSINHPIAGDRLYGFKKMDCPAGLNRMFLHAASLEITMPGGERKKFEVKLPKELEQVVSALKSQSVSFVA